MEYCESIKTHLFPFSQLNGLNPYKQPTIFSVEWVESIQPTKQYSLHPKL